MPQQQAMTWQSARRIVFRGPKLTDFLQGYLTCRTDRLSDGEWIATAICNVKGRVVVSGWAQMADEQEVSLLVHDSLAERTVAFLTPYARFARCEISIDDEPVVIQQQDGGTIVGKWQVLEQQPAKGVADDLLAMDLALAAFAFISAPVSEQFLPQMINLPAHQAVDFDKGCYLGQEVVARAQFRGAVKRTLSSTPWSESPPTIGEKWQDHGVVIWVANSKDNGASGIALTVS